jgi:mannose/cellobiose epimerase-like protein (N-acyl-D-glucosamine 2-epimerase family)
VRVLALKLKADVWKFWLTNGPDSNGLGVYGTLDQTGNPIEPFDKGLIQQSRHLWAFTMCYNLHERSPRVKAAAGALYKLISTKFRDPKDGRFFYKVAPR